MVPDRRLDLGLPAPAVDGVPVLFMSSNGVGMGHVTRLLAIALRAEPTVRPVFLSLSRAVGVVDGFGLPWEHLGSYSHPAVDANAWADLLSDHVVAAIDRWGIRALVFDGVAPYRGLQDALDRRRGVHRVWVRRGLWLPTADRRRDDVDWFDLVVEPGELGADDATDDDPVVVDPVTLVDRAQLLSRDEAREVLGLPHDARVLLLALGSGTLTDLATPMRAVMEGLSRERWVVARPRSPLPGAMVPPDLDVRTFAAYPMARLFSAFDAAIAASGYNAFHELVVGRVPSLFVPQPRKTDDQFRRAMQGVDAGVALAAPTVDAIPGGVEELLRVETRRDMQERLAARSATNGAVAAAAALTAMVDS